MMKVFNAMILHARTPRLSFGRLLTRFYDRVREWFYARFLRSKRDLYSIDDYLLQIELCARARTIRCFEMIVNSIYRGGAPHR